ncbi:MAG: hypothetical protein E7620_05555, partial [Ruminococcaceae bacterium]|nr:hypothetical protein [Oscillospiraceae bacterium]
GFRGEALAAIASVSDIRILSKTADAEFGAVLEAHGGEQITVTEQGCTTGTSVIVENLFANVPARRKFLKKDVTETMAVTANVEKIALSNPHIAVRLLVDGNVRMETAGDGNLKNTVYALYGRDFATRLLEISGENEGIEVTGFIGRSDNFKANRNFENFFVNGRFVKSKTAVAALEQAYTSYMPPEKFPCCVINISVNPARVDVNVHPAKLEVKFSNEKAIFEAVYYTVRSALEANVTRPSMNLENSFRKGGAARMSDATVPVENERQKPLRQRQLTYDWTGTTQHQPQERMTAAEYRAEYGGAPDKKSPKAASQPPKETPKPQPLVSEPEKITKISEETVTNRFETATDEVKDIIPDSSAAAAISARQQAPKAAEPSPAPAEAPSAEKRTAEPPPPTVPSEPVPSEETAFPAVPVSYRIVGEVFHAYVIVELEEKLLLIDQHAAHERILFEQLKAGLHQAEAVSQILMLPVETMMTAAEVEALRQYEEELTKIGFALRFARNTVFADAIPEGVETNAVSDLLGTMAGRLLDNTGSVKLTRDIVFEKALYQAACKAAIKAGRAYPEGHIAWLVKQLMELPDITFCPHGRPVAMELSKRTLDRQFDRLGF